MESKKAVTFDKVWIRLRFCARWKDICVWNIIKQRNLKKKLKMNTMSWLQNENCCLLRNLNALWKGVYCLQMKDILAIIIVCLFICLCLFVCVYLLFAFFLFVYRSVRLLVILCIFVITCLLLCYCLGKTYFFVICLLPIGHNSFYIYAVLNLSSWRWSCKKWSLWTSHHLFSQEVKKNSFLY